MPPRVYVETSVVSYLTARPSRNLVVSAHQELTRCWWHGRESYSLFISQVVLDEIGLGDAVERERR